MLVFRDRTVGLYDAATRLAETCGDTRLEWLQRIAEAITTRGASPEKIVIPYLDWRKIEGRGVHALDDLAERRYAAEPATLAQDLRTVRIDSAHLTMWLAQAHGLGGCPSVEPEQEEDVVKSRVDFGKEILARERRNRRGQKETTEIRQEIVKIIDAHLTGKHHLTHAEIGGLFIRPGLNVSTAAKVSRGRRYRGLKS